MPKQKTVSGVKKRFKVTGAGRLLRRRAMISHNLEKKSRKRKRRLSKDARVAPTDARAIKKQLGIG